MARGGKKILRTDGWRSINYTVDPAHLNDDQLPAGFNFLLRSREGVPIRGSARLSGSSLNGTSFFGTSGRVDYIRQFFDTARGKVVVLAHDRVTGQLKIIEDYVGATIPIDEHVMANGLLAGNAVNEAGFDHAAGTGVALASDFEGQGSCVGEAVRWVASVETYYAWRCYREYNTSILTGKTVIRARLLMEVGRDLQSSVDPDTDVLEVRRLPFGTLAPGDWPITGGTLIASIPVYAGGDPVPPFWNDRVLQHYNIRDGSYDASRMSIELNPAWVNLSGMTQFQYLLQKERTGANVLPEITDEDHERILEIPSSVLLVETA